MLPVDPSVPRVGERNAMGLAAEVSVVSEATSHLRLLATAEKLYPMRHGPIPKKYTERVSRMMASKDDMV